MLSALTGAELLGVENSPFLEHLVKCLESTFGKIVFLQQMLIIEIRVEILKKISDIDGSFFMRGLRGVHSVTSWEQCQSLIIYIQIKIKFIDKLI